MCVAYASARRLCYFVYCVCYAIIVTNSLCNLEANAMRIIYSPLPLCGDYCHIRSGQPIIKWKEASKQWLSHVFAYDFFYVLETAFN
jgi:hypothetical protein